MINPPGDKIVVYIAKPCGFCTAAIRYLQEVKQLSEIEVIDLTGRFAERRALVEVSGQRTVPQIFIYGEHVGGYDDLRAKDNRGEIDMLLRIQ